jgi:peptide/nickel transport system substrate-binding protein
VLSAPFTPFLGYTSIGLLPEHIYANTPPKELAASALNNHPIGAGPLSVERIAADHIRLKPNPYYAGPIPYIPALEFHFYPDHPSLFAAFVAGEIDGISTILPTDLPIATTRTDLQVFSVALSGYVLVEFNLNNPNVLFFQDKSVRQALYYGLDRQGLIDHVVAGEGILAHSLLLPEHWAYNPDVKKYDYNPQQAQQLLDQAGWQDSNGDGVRDKNGQPLQFVLNAVDDATQTALIQRIAEDWAKIGVRAVPTPVTYVGLVGDLLTPRKFDAAVVKWEQFGDPDPYPLWHSSQAEGGARNYTSWRHPEADQIMEKARTILNNEERKALYRQFQEIFAEEAPGVILYHPVYSYGVSKRVHNVQIGALNEPSARFENFADWYIVTQRLPSNQAPASIPPTPPGATSP